MEAILESFGCGGWIRTNDLRVMSPTSYQTAPPRDEMAKLVLSGYSVHTLFQN